METGRGLYISEGRLFQAGKLFYEGSMYLCKVDCGVPGLAG